MHVVKSERKAKGLSILVAALMIAGVLFVFSAKQASAGSTLNTGVVGWTNANGDSVALTVAHPGDQLSMYIEVLDNNAGGVKIVNVASVTDTFGDVWSLVGDTWGLIPQIGSGASCSVATCIDTEIWQTTASVSGSDSIVVTVSTSLAQGNIQVMDMVGVGSASSTDIGYCMSPCSTAYSTLGQVAYHSGDVPTAAIFTACEAASVLTPGTGYSLVGDHAPHDGDAMYSLNEAPSPGLPANPTTWPSSCSGGSGTWIVLGTIFPASGASTVTVTVTQTATTATTTQGGGTISGSGTYIYGDSMYWNQGQNPINVQASVINFTAKLEAVHIASATASFYLMAYSGTTANTPASASQPLQLLYSHQFTITNGTTNVLLTWAVPVTNYVCPLCYYAIALQTNGNKSNSATVSGSGVEVYQATLITGSWQAFDVGANIIPISIYFGIGPQTAMYAYLRLQWPVGIDTITTTKTTFSSTTTYTSAIYTSTVSSTVTSTSTYLVNQSNPANTSFYYLPLFYILLFFALFSGIGIFLKGERNEGG